MEDPATDQRLGSFYEALHEEREHRASCPITREIRELEARYPDGQVIARGGMKEILKVRDGTSGRMVAMARLLDDVPE